MHPPTSALRSNPTELVTPTTHRQTTNAKPQNIPTPNIDQTDAAGSARRSPAAAVVPPNHATPT